MFTVGRFLLQQENDGSNSISYLVDGFRYKMCIRDLPLLFENMIASNHNFVVFFLECLSGDPECTYYHPNADKIFNAIELQPGSGHLYFLTQILKAYNQAMQTTLLKENIIPLLPNQEWYK